MTSSAPSHTPTTAAFYVQAVLSFGLSLTSAFTLAKVIRDRQEDTTISSRVDRARLDKLLTEHDPFKIDAA